MSGEFDGIFIVPGGSRPLMSKPPRVKASTEFARRVRDTVAVRGGVHMGDQEALEVADWVADLMERFGAATSQPVFTMDGQGPVCSWCGSIWPLCGHHHLSEVEFDDAIELAEDGA